MLAVGRLAGDPHRPERNGGGHQVEAGMGGLGKDAQAIGPQADAQLRAGQQDGRHQGCRGHATLIAVGLKQQF